MTIEVICSKCAKQYRLQDSLAGRKVQCKNCGQKLTVPSPKESHSSEPSSPPRERQPKRSEKATTLPPIPDPFAEFYDDDDSVPKASPGTKPKRPVKKPIPKPRSMPSVEENLIAEALDDSGDFATDDALEAFKDESLSSYSDPFSDPLAHDFGDDMEQHEAYTAMPKRRRKKKKKKTSSLKSKDRDSKPVSAGLPPMTFNVNRLNIGMVILGGILIFIGVNEFRLAMGSSSTAKEMTLAELCEDGPGDERHLMITGIQPISDGYVANETSFGRMTEVWYACVPKGGSAVSKFIVYSRDTDSEDDVARLMASDTLTGTLVSNVTKLDFETRTYLKQLHPDTQIDPVYVFQAGKGPAGFFKYAGLMLSGLLLVGLGVGWILFVHEG